MRFKIIKAKYYLVTLVILLVVFMGASCTLPGITMLKGSAVNPAQTTVSATITPATSQSSPSTMDIVLSVPDFTTLIAAIRPSVVAITTEITVHSFFGRAFTEEGAGSGWIIDSDGLIVTNNHVVEGANKITITLEDGRTFSAQSVATDTNADLAIIKIDAHDLPVLQTGDSSKLMVGEWVVAIGNSLGLGISATKGIVSALDVSLSNSPGETLKGLIQTDAPINPGNSGGPLLNLDGEVIGINSAKVAQVSVEGIGYAISMKEALPIIDQLKSKISE
jgi:S1-C subfamily serine protease